MHVLRLTSTLDSANAFGLIDSRRLVYSRASLANQDRGRVVRARNRRRSQRQQADLIFATENAHTRFINEPNIGLRAFLGLYDSSMRGWISTPRNIQFGYRHRRNRF